MSDSLPFWRTRVRKDPLSAKDYYDLALDRYRWVERQYSYEHVVVDGASVGTAGQHNAPEIPREVGSIYTVAGPLYSIEDFRYATAATRLATGSLTLDLDPAPYSSTTDMAVQIQNCSENGINKPCLTSQIVVSTSSIAIFHRTLTSALGAGNTWAAEDANCAVAVHGPALAGGGWLLISKNKMRGLAITDETDDINASVQADADLRAMFLLEHDSAGNHTAREVAQAWASIGVRSGGGAFDILDTGTRNRCTAATYVGAGICELTFQNAWVLSAQPFVSTDCQRLNGGAEADIYNSVTPRSFITTTTLRVYLYKYTAGSPGTWARADTDFFVAVHGGY